MKKLSKTIAVALALILVLGMVTGCKTNAARKNEKQETLRVFFNDSSSPDKGLVEEAVSKITKEKLGVNIEFVMFGPGEYKEKIPLLLASNEKMDIGFDAGWLAYIERAKQGAYYDITDLLKTKGEKLYNTVDQMLWKGIEVNNKIYGVPTYKEIAEQWAIYAEEDVLKSNNINPDSIKNLGDVETILEALKKDPSRAGFMVNTANTWHVNLDKFSKFDTATGDFVVARQEGKTILNYYLSPEYKNFVRLMRSWYNKGYIAKDIATRENYDEYIKNGNQKYGVSIVSYAPLNEIFSSKSYGKALVPIFITPTIVSNDSTRGSIFGVYKKSQNPEKAFEFLQLWNTDPQIKNLITYGIEGKHYNLVDGKAVRVKDVEKMYVNQNWATGNVFLSYLSEGEPDNKYEEYKKFNSRATSACTLGFTPDVASVSDKLAACTAAVKEFSPLLNVGVVDSDEYLPKFEATLKAAGVDEVTKVLQDQYNSWLANK